MDRELLQWRILMYDDLRAAKRALRSRPGAAGAFLRARIAEDHAILDRVEQMERDVGASVLVDVSAMSSTR
jgi:hypothetical protein